MPKKKIVRKKTVASKKKLKKKPTRKVRKPEPPPIVAVGEVVRLPVEIQNQIVRYDPRLARVEHGAEAIEGIVYSIREIGTGKLVPKTRDSLQGYVLEVLHNRTFQGGVSSEKNTGGAKAPENVSENISWKRLRSLLQELTSRKELFNLATSGLSKEVFGTMLDGWRVVKVKAETVERIE